MAVAHRWAVCCCDCWRLLVTAGAIAVPQWLRQALPAAMLANLTTLRPAFARIPLWLTLMAICLLLIPCDASAFSCTSPLALQRLTLAAQGSTVELRCAAPAAKSFQLYGHTARVSCAAMLRAGSGGAALQRLGVVTGSHDQTVRWVPSPGAAAFQIAGCTHWVPPAALERAVYSAAALLPTAEAASWRPQDSRLLHALIPSHLQSV